MPQDYSNYLDKTGLSYLIKKIYENQKEAIGDLSSLETQNKETIVGALNEIIYNNAIIDLGTLDINMYTKPDEGLLDITEPGIYKFHWLNDEAMPEEYCYDLLFVAKDTGGRNNQIWLNAMSGTIAVRGFAEGVPSVGWSMVLIDGDVVNSLTSDWTNRPLSAKQGKILNEKKADKMNENGGGFEGGESSQATDGAAVGFGATETGGGFAGGRDSKTSIGSATGFQTISNGGDAGGCGAGTRDGAANGHSAYSENGGASGSDAMTKDGFSGGLGTRTSDGVAAGKNAKCVDEDGNPIDAVQLGEGTNTEPRSFQVYDKKMMDANGNIPAERLLNVALKNSASGEVIKVNDMLNVEHPLDVTVRSKNLIPYPYTDKNKVNSGITFTDNGDGTVTADGTAEQNAWYMFNKITIEEDGNYFYSGSPLNGGSNTYRLFAGITRNGTVTYYSDVGEGIVLSLLKGDIIEFRIFIGPGTTVNQMMFKPMFEKGNTATEYTPPVSDLSTVKVNRYGKNLFDVGEIGDYYCYNPKTYDYYITEGRIGINKVSPSAMSYILKENESYYPGTYTISGCIAYHFADSAYSTMPRLVFKLFDSDGNVLTENGIISGCNYNTHYKAHHKVLYISEKNFSYTFTVPAIVAYWQLGFIFGVDRSDGGSVIDGNVEYSNIQLEIGDTATEYAPYAGTQTVTANPDGRVEGLTSVSPNMTVLTDTPGVVIDMTYNIDTKTYIDQKIAALQALLLEE